MSNEQEDRLAPDHLGAWEHGYERGYGHGTQDMMALALIIIKEVNIKDGDDARYVCLDIRKQLVAKFNELTKDTE